MTLRRRSCVIGREGLRFSICVAMAFASWRPPTQIGRIRSSARLRSSTSNTTNEGSTVAPSRQEALESDIVVTVTPGRELLFPSGSLRDGQHVSMMGADGPGKAEVAVGELARADLFCDDWEQASHGGELAAGVVAGVVTPTA